MYHLHQVLLLFSRFFLYCDFSAVGQVYDSYFSSHRMVGMVASLEAVQLTWCVTLFYFYLYFIFCSCRRCY